LRKASKLAKEVTDSVQRLLLSTVELTISGWVQLQRGSLEEAEDDFRKALLEYKELPGEFAKPLCVGVRALAKEYNRRGVAIAQAPDNHSFEFTTNQARLHRAIEQFDKAMHVLDGLPQQILDDTRTASILLEDRAQTLLYRAKARAALGQEAAADTEYDHA